MELCIAEHYPTQVHLKDGEWLEEPPSVEGFVYTVDAKTQRRTQLFLSTHDNYLFRVPFNRAVSPSSPSDLKNYSKNEKDLRKEEASRLRSQVINSKAFWDLRHVLVVRRASHIYGKMNDPNVPTDSTASFNHDISNEQLLSRLEEGVSNVLRNDSDMEDEGGDDGLAKAKNKSKIRMYRSFELVLKNGRILRFEVSFRRRHPLHIIDDFN